MAPGSAARRSQIRLKRAFDVLIALAALVLLAPVLLAIAVAIRLESNGPAIFRQKRWGVNKTVVEIYKFRSMRTELCDFSGVVQTVRDDPRVTKVGRFLRRSNLDELPQLINVLRGDMSLVGPRCHAIGMMAAGRLYEELVPNYHERHAMRPGITGLAQARGLRGPTSSAYKARARILSDIHYIKNFSLVLDMAILVSTIRSELVRGSGF
jgi:lipopolysaccharide/colanic/teichoic acid biosynthesis glycosyltransferase